MDIALTRMSSKGRVVIPADMRRDIAAGEKLVIIKDGDRLILEKVGANEATLKEDLEFARRTEEAYQSYERGEFVSMSSEEFLRELETW